MPKEFEIRELLYPFGNSVIRDIYVIWHNHFTCINTNDRLTLFALEIEGDNGSQVLNCLFILIYIYKYHMWMYICTHLCIKCVAFDSNGTFLHWKNFTHPQVWNHYAPHISKRCRYKCLQCGLQHQNLSTAFCFFIVLWALNYNSNSSKNFYWTKKPQYI